MNESRRQLCISLPMLMASTAFADDAKALQSFIDPFERLPAKQNATGTSRAILDGSTHSGDHIEVHETTLDPGRAPPLRQM